MTFRTYFDLDGSDRSRLLEQVQQQRAQVADRLARVARTVAVMSGKGGVGKSYVTTVLARACAGRGQRVGVLDADLRSPTVARALRAHGPLRVTDDGVHPATGDAGIRVMSTDFLLEDGRPLAWRGPEQERHVWRGTLEATVLREFLGHVLWGDLDLLLIDLPPGADAATELTPLISNLRGVLAVTIPSDESRRSVARALHAARDADLPILGIIENMSGEACPECGAVRPLFSGNAGAALAREFAVPLVASLPFTREEPDPRLMEGVVDVLLENTP